MVSVPVHHDRFVAVHRLGDERLGELIQQQPLDGPLDRPCAELRVVTLLGDQCPRVFRHVQLHIVVLQHLVEACDLHVDDLSGVLLRERGEHDDLIDTVEELRTDGLLQQAEHLLFGLRYGLLPVLVRDVLELLRNEGRTQVGGHDDDRVLEVDETTLVVRQTTVVQYLQ